MNRLIDIWDVVCVLSRNYTPGSEAHEVMGDRLAAFDDMSLDRARALSRRALQVLQPHLLDGVVVGDVDIDRLLREQAEMPLNDNDVENEDVDDVSMEGVEAPGGQGGDEEEEEQDSDVDEGLQQDPVRGILFYPHG